MKTQLFKWFLNKLSDIDWNMFLFKGIYFIYLRKIVHLPKKDVYDENGLYKGVGRLADRVHTDIQIN